MIWARRASLTRRARQKNQEVILSHSHAQSKKSMLARAIALSTALQSVHRPDEGLAARMRLHRISSI